MTQSCRPGVYVLYSFCVLSLVCLPRLVFFSSSLLLNLRQEYIPSNRMTYWHLQDMELIYFAQWETLALVETKRVPRGALLWKSHRERNKMAVKKKLLEKRIISSYLEMLRWLLYWWYSRLFCAVIRVINKMRFRRGIKHNVIFSFDFCSSLQSAFSPEGKNNNLQNKALYPPSLF